MSVILNNLVQNSSLLVLDFSRNKCTDNVCIVGLRFYLCFILIIVDRREAEAGLRTEQYAAGDILQLELVQGTNLEGAVHGTDLKHLC